MKIKASTYITTRGTLQSKTGQLYTASLLDTAAIYTAMGVDYPRFFKMDKLSQTAFLLAEDLLKGDLPAHDCSIQLWNQHASYTADIQHLENIKNGVPGPANFTYTLPNIMLGELSIRYQLFSETAVFISGAPPDFGQMEQTLRLYLEETGETRILAGWVDVSDNAYGFICDIRVDNETNVCLADEFRKLFELLIL